jgi:hypothetical protein
MHATWRTTSQSAAADVAEGVIRAKTGRVEVVVADVWHAACKRNPWAAVHVQFVVEAGWFFAGRWDARTRGGWNTRVGNVVWILRRRDSRLSC